MGRCRQKKEARVLAMTVPVKWNACAVIAAVGAAAGPRDDDCSGSDY